MVVDTDDAEVSDGVLNKDATRRRLQTNRLPPDPTLSGIVSHYWILRWDIPAGERHTISTLGRLGCSFVWTESASLLYGVQRARFSYELSGNGRITGAKLTPAGIRAFCETPAHLLTDQAIDLVPLLDPAPTFGDELRRANDRRVSDILDESLTRQELRVDPRIRLANDAVDAITAQPRITQVSGIAVVLGMSVRSLQKLMREYIGAGTKWVIERLRVIEAVRSLESDRHVDLALLAQRLGYYDQAHLTTAFRAAVGTTPHSYRRGLEIAPSSTRDGESARLRIP